MSWTKRSTCICDECRLFCRPFDEYTSFGCKDPEAPEPLDPKHCCKKCWPIWKNGWDKYFSEEHKYWNGDWMKSRAEKESAERHGLIWLHGTSVGTYNGTFQDTENYISGHKWIKKEIHERLSNLPKYANHIT